MKQKKTDQQNTNRPPTKADRKLTIQLLKETSRFDKVDMAENRFMIPDLFFRDELLKLLKRCAR